MRESEIADRIEGYVWGAAVGDAMGARLKQKASGVDDPGSLAITALTQTVLFGGEALIRAYIRANTKGIAPDFRALFLSGLEHWMRTQVEEPARDIAKTGRALPPGWLIGCEELWRRADPSTDTVGVLRKGYEGGLEGGNGRRGSSGLAFAAVTGLAAPPLDARRVRNEADSIAALTHDSAEARSVAGATAVLVWQLVHAQGSWPDARRHARAVAGEHLISAGEPDWLALLDAADSDADLGDGTTAASALAIAIRAVHRAATFGDVLAHAAQHGDAVRTTAQLAGAIAGARHGKAFVPAHLRDRLHERWVVEALARDLARWMSRGADAQPGPDGFGETTSEGWVFYRFGG